MGYIKITDAQKRLYDEMKSLGQVGVASELQNLTFNNVTSVSTAGSTGATTTNFVFKAPTKALVTGATVLITTANTGSSNTPDVQLYNETQGNIIATATVALSHTAGDTQTMTLTAANQDIALGDVLSVRIVNPSATITVALAAKVQFEWHSVA